MAKFLTIEEPKIKYVTDISLYIRALRVKNLDNLCLRFLT